WQGIGAYLVQHPQIRYLFGPVSMSAQYPAALMEELVYCFEHYYGSAETLATARTPFALTPTRAAEREAHYRGLSREAGLARLQEAFAAQDCRMPVLFRQYTALFGVDGFRPLVFTRDPDFANCLDGLCLTDLQ